MRGSTSRLGPSLRALRAWGRVRVRLGARAYLGTAEPPVDGRAVVAPKAPTIFSSRAKITAQCPAWLKSSRSRANLLKNFDVEEAYDADYSSIQILTPKAPSQVAADGSPIGPHKLVIKSFKKAKLLQRPDIQQKVKLEWDIMTALLGHPNIIRGYLATEDDVSVGLYMEYAGESDAYSYLTAKQRLSLREDDARHLMHGVLSGLLHMHEQGIVHRDVKSENVFRTDCGTWKLGDFGSALRLGDSRTLERQVLKLEGTFSFAAPEYVRIWKGFQRSQLIDATSFKLDSWSAGALAYDVLCGRAPFATHEGISRDEEAEGISGRDPEFPSGLSYDAVSFIMQALEKCPQKRPSIRQLLAHSWFDKPKEATPGPKPRRSRSSSSVGGGALASSSSSSRAESSSGGVATAAR